MRSEWRGRRSDAFEVTGMNVEEIIGYMDHVFPMKAAMDFDNVGLLIGERRAEVSSVYVAVDVTERTIAEAKAVGAQLIVAHHPLIFSPFKRINDDTILGRRILDMISSGIACAAMHTNYDVFRMGKIVAGRLSLQDEGPLEITWSQEDGRIQEGIGRIGMTADPVSLEEFAKTVRDALHLDHVRLFGEPRARIRRVALCPGSGKSMIRSAIDQRADVLIAGDIGHHEGIDALAEGLCIIDPGHYGSESVFVDDICGLLRERFPDLRVSGENIVQPVWAV